MIKSIGNLKIDQLNVKYNCQKINQLFPNEDQTDKSYNNLKLGNIYTLAFDTTVNISEIVKEYDQTDEFEYVEPNYIGKGGGVSSLTPNDPFFNKQWALKNTGDFLSGKAGADIKMDVAWQITQGSSDVILAILDTGCKLDHPELSNRIWTNGREVLNNEIDDDQNGYIDDILLAVEFFEIKGTKVDMIAFYLYQQNISK